MEIREGGWSKDSCSENDDKRLHPETPAKLRKNSRFTKQPACG
ncbi:hypothetical protein [Duncaniella muris]|nr:hypothetical protein [Duncaniella muris]